MVCRNEDTAVEIIWDNKATYGFVFEPEKTQQKIVKKCKKKINLKTILYKKIIRMLYI